MAFLVVAGWLPGGISDAVLGHPLPARRRPRLFLLKPGSRPVDGRGMELTAGALCAMLVISSIGFALFVYGKKQVRVPQLVAGVLLMGFPYFVADALWMSGIATALLAGLWLGCRAGW